MEKNRDKEIGRICQELREKLAHAVQDMSYDGTLLSGGLDTAIINYIASGQKNALQAVTVGFEGSPMQDLKYARIVAKELGLKHHVRTFDLEEVKRAAREVVKITRSFDPMEVRNSVSIYVALKEAGNLGMKTVLTGDGGDELFAGYSFLYNLPLEKLQQELEGIWKIMIFSSVPIAESLGMKAELPYLEQGVKEFSMGIPAELKVGWRNGVKFGKWILRRAYKGCLPDDIIWRVKAPIEVGSGTTVLPEKFGAIIEDEFFESERRRVREEDGVYLRSKEQFYYYDIYNSIFGPPKTDNPDRRTCPYCKINIPQDARFCRTCGASIKNVENTIAI